MFVDFCCICRTKMSSEDRGHCLPHSSLCTAAAAGNHPGSSSSLPHWTNHQIQFSLWSDGVITQSVLIWGKYKVCSREKNVNVWFMCRRDVGSGNYISAQRLWSTWLLPTCKRFPFIEQPLLVCWYVETFGHKFLHCGDLFIFSHLEDQQYDDVVTLFGQITLTRTFLFLISRGVCKMQKSVTNRKWSLCINFTWNQLSNGNSQSQETTKPLPCKWPFWRILFIEN